MSCTTPMNLFQDLSALARMAGRVNLRLAPGASESAHLLCADLLRRVRGAGSRPTPPEPDDLCEYTPGAKGPRKPNGGATNIVF